MDLYGSTTNRIATRGVGSCICFTIFYNDGNVFLQHRSDLHFPSQITTKYIGETIQEVIKDATREPPTSAIT